MRKKIIFILFILLTSFGFTNVAYAATASMKVTVNKSSLVVGNNITATVTVSSTTPMANWEFNLNYDSSKLTFVSSSYDFHVVDLDMTQNKKTATYTYVFRAKSAGTASISLGASSVLDWNGNEMNLNKSSASVKIITQQQLEDSYSKNADLSSLSITGYNLTPSFDKDTLEYTVLLDPETTSIEVNATKADRTASISGTGKIETSEGNNTIKVVVTAQKGNTKTYIINAVVQELEPIEVSVDNVKYTIVRKEDALVYPSNYFQKTTATIDGNEVPAFYNDIANITLVCLKDSSGDIKLFSYDNNNYKLYNEIKFNQMVIQLLDMDETLIPEGYKINKINIGENAISAYQKDGYEYPLIYAMNVETGEKHIYTYDNVENTLQRYVEPPEGKEQLYFYIIIGLFGFLVLSYFVFIVMLSNKNSKRLETTIKIEKKPSKQELKEIKKREKFEVERKKRELKKQQKLEKALKKQFKKKINDDIAKLD